MKIQNTPETFDETAWPKGSGLAFTVHIDTVTEQIDRIEKRVGKAAALNFCKAILPEIEKRIVRLSSEIT